MKHLLLLASLALGLATLSTEVGRSSTHEGDRRFEVVAIDPVSGLEVDMITTAAAGGGSSENKEEGAPAPGGVTPTRVDTKVSGDKPTEAAPISGQQLLSEIAILEKLAARRKQLEDAERQLGMREDLLKAAEGRIGGRIDELKAIEERIGAADRAKEEAKRKEILDLARIYEAMKPKDAARVLERLDPPLMAEVARSIPPKKLAEIVAKMAPEKAEQLSTRLAGSTKAGMAVAAGQ